LHKSLAADPHPKSIIDALRLDPTAAPNFSISSHKLYFKDKLVIPADDVLRNNPL
jgi:hypothetical protein